MKQIFLRFIDWFIPSAAKMDAATLGRARIFTFSHLFGPFLGQAITVFLYFADPTHGFPYWVIVGCITAFWILPFALKLTGQLTKLAFFSVANLTFATLFGSYFYGGVSSPFLPWLLTAVLLGFFYLGERPLLVLSIFAINIAGFYLAYALTGSFPQRVPLEALSGVGLVSVFAATIYVSMMAIYYAYVVASQSELEGEAERHRETAIKLREAKEDAERANRAKSVFLAKMSHELRTPLNVVIGYSEILIEDSDSDAQETQIADLRRINSAGKHLLSLVTDVLDMSKIEADTTELVAQPFDLAKFADNIAATARSVVTHQNNAFIVNCGADLGMAIGDETRLSQATLNLLGNAGKFTKNGRVTLAVSREQTANGDWISIAVRDTGIGIKPEALQKLFKDFNQADASTATKYGGTGLGLALSRDLCRLMGGDISVDSSYGLGSCFTIRVPAYLDTSQTPASAGEMAAHDDGLPSHAA